MYIYTLYNNYYYIIIVINFIVPYVYIHMAHAFRGLINPLGASTYNLIKYTHAALVTRILESAAARCSLSAAEFRNRDSVVLFTDRHGKDAKMFVLLLTTAIYIICYACAASAVIFYLCMYRSS